MLVHHACCACMHHFRCRAQVADVCSMAAALHEPRGAARQDLQLDVLKGVARPRSGSVPDVCCACYILACLLGLNTFESVPQCCLATLPRVSLILRGQGCFRATCSCLSFLSLFGSLSVTLSVALGRSLSVCLSFCLVQSSSCQIFGAGDALTGVLTAGDVDLLFCC
jgi:hypothetical protein